MKEITQLEELKEIELDIMKKVHNFCVSNSIKYCLTYGTLLGAMRHGGFIPWDDDIDIFMLRDDYDRFLELFPKYQNQMGLTIVNHNTKPYYGRAMSKVIDNRTYLIEPDFLYDDPIGVFIDIWPLDYVPQDERAREHHTDKIRHYNRQLYGCITKELKFRSLSEIKTSIKQLLYRRMNPKSIVEKIILLSTQYRNTPSDYLICSTVAKRIFNTEFFKDLFLTKFEDTEFYVPSHYDEVLTLCYGNWRMLPPKDKQVPHHVMNVYWK